MRWNKMVFGRLRQSATAIVLVVASVAVVATPRSAAARDESGPAQEVPVRERWNGDYPVAELKRFPAEQQKSSPGFIGDAETFAALWEAFKPNEKAPSVDFAKNLVVFSRNLDFYNRTSIAKVLLKDGVADVLAIETMSARPIEDKVAMGLAVVPRERIRFVRSRDKLIPVPSH